MKRIRCINDRRWNIGNNKYTKDKSPALTKGKVYDVIEERETDLGNNYGLHYKIKPDHNFLLYVWAWHARFITLNLSNNIKLL